MTPFVSGWRGAVDRRPCWGTIDDGARAGASGGAGGEGGRMEMEMGMGRGLDAASSMASRTSLDGLAVAVAVEDTPMCESEGGGAGGVCLIIFVSDSSDRVLSSGEGGRGTCVGASGGASGASGRRRGIIWPGASGGGVGSSVVRSARRAAGGMISAG